MAANNCSSSRSHPTETPSGIGLRVVVHTKVDGRTTDLLFKHFPVRIGRNALNELVLNHPYVSQWHAVIGFVHGALTVAQVGSTNSATINDHRLGPNTEIALGRSDVIRIVPFEIHTQLISLPNHRATQTQNTPSIMSTLPQTNPASSEISTISTAIVERLARRFLGEMPDNQTDVARFGAHLEETLDVFFRSLIALRSGQEHFRSMLDIPILQNHDRQDPVLSATSAEALAFAMLEPAAPKRSAILESIFKDLMIHQVALINGLMAGVRNLLKKTSPEAIVASARRNQRGGSSKPPGLKILWDTFESVHRNLSEEEHITFDAIFGRHFDQAYATVATGKKDT